MRTGIVSLSSYGNDVINSIARRKTKRSTLYQCCTHDVYSIARVYFHCRLFVPRENRLLRASGPLIGVIKSTHAARDDDCRSVAIAKLERIHPHNIRSLLSCNPYIIIL